MNVPYQDPLIHTTLQSYHILESLGSGAVADVYKARDINSGQFYALKVMQARWVPFPHVMPRFEAEAQLLFDLPHPHIVKAFPPLGYLNQEPTRPYFAMEYLDGGSLSDYLRGGGLLTFGQASELIANICAALHFAHRRGVIHRDLKPANILLRERLVPESAVLTDFGIAKIVYQTQMTELGNQPGTPEYMSPEQFRSQEATHLSDQYALGVILYWMMTHRLPFRLSDPTPIGIQHLNTIPPYPSYINPDVTPDLDHVVMRALSKDPYYRFPDMTQLALAFTQAVSSAQIESVPVNAMGGSRPTGQGTSNPAGTLRMPGPTNTPYHGTGPGLPSSQVAASNASGAAPSPMSRPAPDDSRSMMYAIVGVGGLIAVLLVGILGALLSLRPASATPTAVALIAATEEVSPRPTSTRRPTLTPTAEPSNTKAATRTQTPRPTRTPTRLSVGGAVGISPTVAASQTPTPKTRTVTPRVTAAASASATRTPTPGVTKRATSTKAATSASSRTPTKTDTPTRAPTRTLTPTLTVTATPRPTNTPTLAPLTLDEMLTTFNSELGTTITFNCKRFVLTYDTLQNELVNSGSAYERARSLVDESDDYAVQIYDEYCRDNATDTAMKIDAMLYSRFRSETRQLMGD